MHEQKADPHERQTTCICVSEGSPDKLGLNCTPGKWPTVVSYIIIIYSPGGPFCSVVQVFFPQTVPSQSLSHTLNHSHLQSVRQRERKRQPISSHSQSDRGRERGNPSVPTVSQTEGEKEATHQFPQSVRQRERKRQPISSH